MPSSNSIDDPRITVYGHLFEAHALVTQALDKELQAAVGISLPWYGVLLHVARSREGIRPMRELIEATAFTSGGVTRLVDRMEMAGLVERRPCPTDRRAQNVALTDAGRALLDTATSVHLNGIQRHLMDRLEPHEVLQLDAILAKLAH